MNNKNNNIHIKSNAAVYTIQCLDCNKNILGKHSVIFKNEFMNIKVLEKRKQIMVWSDII